MEELMEQILNDAQSLRDKISELGNHDEYDGHNQSHYQKLNDALCDFIGDY
jgi:hypothetical protein